MKALSCTEHGHYPVTAPDIGYWVAIGWPRDVTIQPEPISLAAHYDPKKYSNDIIGAGTTTNHPPTISRFSPR